MNQVKDVISDHTLYKCSVELSYNKHKESRFKSAGLIVSDEGII